MNITNLILGILFILGILVLLKLIAQFLKFIYYLFSCCGTNLAKRYGEGSYVMITGSTSGIGKAFAMEFARLGFNLILLDKSNTQLNQTKEEILKASPQTKVETHMWDMAFEPTVKAVTQIGRNFQSYDISLLINNAGIRLIEEYEKFSLTEIEQMVNINMISTTLLTRQFINKLKARDKSGIIFVSSLASLFEFPYLQVFTATKAYTDFFAMGLRGEYPKIDIFLDRPGRVQTNSYRGELSFACCTPEEHVKKILVDFPCRRHTYGIVNHRIISGFAKLIEELPKQLARPIKRYQIRNENWDLLKTQN